MHSLNDNCIYVRHGETVFNSKAHTAYSSVKHDVTYMNCALTPRGQIQAVQVGQRVKDLNVIAVFASPFRRTIQTAILLVKNHSCKEKITVFVHPLLGEVVESVQGLCCDVEEMKREFNMEGDVKVNWSEYFEKEFSSQREEHLFSIQMYVDAFSRKQYERIVLPVYKTYDKGGNVREVIGKLVEYAKKSGMKRLESLEHGYERAKKFKMFLKERYGNDNDGKVIVVTHKTFIKLSTTQWEKCNQKDCYDCDNCEMVYVNI